MAPRALPGVEASSLAETGGRGGILAAMPAEPPSSCSRRTLLTQALAAAAVCEFAPLVALAAPLAIPVENVTRLYTVEVARVETPTRHRGGGAGAARLARQGGDRRRPLQHGRADRHRRRPAPRHAANEAGALAARRRAPGAGAGRHHLARPAGRARPATTCRCGRCRASPTSPSAARSRSTATAATSATARSASRCRRCSWCWPTAASSRPAARRTPSLLAAAVGGYGADRRDHRGRARPRRQHEDGAPDRERAARRLPEVLRRQGAGRSRLRDAQRRPDTAAVRRAGGDHLAPYRQAADAHQPPRAARPELHHEAPGAVGADRGAAVPAACASRRPPWRAASGPRSPGATTRPASTSPSSSRCRAPG